MKIDANRPAHDTQATDGTRRTDQDIAVRHGGVTAASQADRVELSGDAALRIAALRAATEAPAVRTELVARMREKFDAGQVGTDATRLADAMLDELLP